MPDFRTFHPELANPRYGHKRMEMFYALPQAEQARYWADLRKRIDSYRAAKLEANRPAQVPEDAHDRLMDIAPMIYVRVIADLELEPGTRANCPLPDHEDHTRDFRVYAEPARGWYCHGCNRGGTIYNFAGLMWDIPTRGRQFKELQQRLYELLC